jgi:hypothetical protein
VPLGVWGQYLPRIESRHRRYLGDPLKRLANLLDFPNFRNLYAFERVLIFEVSRPVFGISRQRFAEFAVDLRNATR